MADRVTSAVRSKIMASVRQKDTGPEVRLRKALHKKGFRYRTHVPNLPGRPDLVFPSRRKVILVHGCFWHGHACRWGRAPKSRKGYWLPKLLGNRRRDRRNLKELRSLGWDPLVVWQCELRKFDRLLTETLQFLRRKNIRRSP